MYSWWHAPQRYDLFRGCSGKYPGHHLGMRTTANPCYGIEDPIEDGVIVRVWCICWWDGEAWRNLDLPEGERPRLRHGFCHIVKE